VTDEAREVTRETIDAVAEKIIGCAYTVQNTLGVGFLEKVYENALAHELRKAGLKVEQQKPVQVVYDCVIVGNYDADLVVEGCVLVELKVAKTFDNVHMAQCLNYLKATGHRLCLLINFGSTRMDYKRVVMNL
jgi:GxxExxY protein